MLYLNIIRLVAVYNMSSEYPVGKRLWYFINESSCLASAEDDLAAAAQAQIPLVKGIETDDFLIIQKIDDWSPFQL